MHSILHSLAATILAALTTEAEAVDSWIEQNNGFRIGNNLSTRTTVYVGDSLTFGYGGTQSRRLEVAGELRGWQEGYRA
jgi:hypothetical protein